MNVCFAEFDGLLITVPVATTKVSDIDPLTGAKLVKSAPIPERIAKVYV
jgi:cobalamin biosynthesis Mg chelatase CobN